jgi:hypothetical protein
MEEQILLKEENISDHADIGNDDIANINDFEEKEIEEKKDENNITDPKKKIISLKKEKNWIDELQKINIYGKDEDFLVWLKEQYKK